MNPNALHLAQLGAEAHSQGDLQLALDFYQKAIEHDRSLPGLLSNLGVVLTNLKEWDKADQTFNEAIPLDPENPALWNNRGNLRKEQKKWQAAITDYTRALDLQPDYLHARYNRGTVFFACDQLLEAEADLRHVLTHDPQMTKAWVNLGETLWELNRSNEAFVCFQQAISLDPQNPEAHWNHALGLLWQGNYAEGWKEYEWRWNLPGVQTFHPTIPLWEGTRDSHLLLYAEQGFGDTIQFSRFLPTITQQVDELTVEVQLPLLAWLQSTYPKITFVAPYQFPPSITHRLPLQSLPLALRLNKPQPQPKKIKKSQLKNSPRKIGFCWSGSEVDPRRRIPLELWKPLFELPHLEWISLQTGTPSKELTKFCSLNSLSIKDQGSQLHHFQQTAEALQMVDLIITIDTALAHLAGTLHKPTWILLPQIADWRWGIAGEKCDWYPTLRCFRQKTRGDWSSVLEEIKKEL